MTPHRAFRLALRTQARIVAAQPKVAPAPPLSWIAYSDQRWGGGRPRIGKEARP